MPTKLSRYAEAVLELEKVKAENRDHPAVMVIRCSVHYAAKNWPLVFELANTLTSVAPVSVSSTTETTPVLLPQ